MVAGASGAEMPETRPASWSRGCGPFARPGACVGFGGLGVWGFRGLGVGLGVWGFRGLGV